MQGFALAVSAVFVLSASAVQAQNIAPSGATPKPVMGDLSKPLPAAPASKGEPVSVSIKKLPPAEQAKFQQVSATAGVNPSNLQGMSLEQAMMTVQTQRANALEKNLKEQLAVVQEKNTRIAKLNGELGAVNAQLANEKDKTRQAALEKQAADIKGQIDGLNNSQQMDMLRLQSLSNKRNEAFETMTNFIKKMQDNRSSIVGNMR